jgi:PAS domain S-box-containing protein
VVHLDRRSLEWNEAAALELARLEAALAAAEGAIAAASDLIARCDRAGVILAVNPAGLALLGRDRGDVMIGRGAEAMLEGEALAALRRGEPWRGVGALRSAEGALLAVEVALRIEGDVRVVVARPVQREVGAASEQARLLARLRSLAAVLENTSDFVALADREGRILYVNPAGMALVGRGGEEPMSLQVADLQAPRDYERLITEIFPYVRQHGSWLGEMFLWHTDGTEIPVSQVITVIRSETGELVGYATISRDITDLKRAELARLRAVEAAEAANRAKSVFLANMSHELRTPLNAILGFAQLLIRGPGLSHEQNEHLAVINRSGEHLLSLINDVLEMSKIEAGRITLNERSFDLHRLLYDLEDMLRLRAREKGLHLAVTLAPDLPRAVMGDSAKLRQVILNLLSNAIKFTDAGGVTLRGSVRAGERVHALRFEVEDSGRGIAAEEQHRLFKPFEQTGSGRHAPEGTGLGLSISQQFVRLMGGEITVRSALGRGSIFSFEVNVGAIAGSGREEEEAPPPMPVGLAPGQPRWRILVVEDGARNREVLVRLLRPLGFDVREAIHGAEAVAIAASWRPDLIWMDIRMPVMDGIEATRIIKASPTGAAAVIVALSANVFEDDRARMREAGCVDFVAKPFREREILGAMSRHLPLKFTYSQGQVEIEAAAKEGARRLPARWREAARGAALAADPAGLTALAAEIAAAAPEVARAIESAAQCFDYDGVLRLLEDDEGDRGAAAQARSGGG